MNKHPKDQQLKQPRKCSYNSPSSSGTEYNAHNVGHTTGAIDTTKRTPTCEKEQAQNRRQDLKPILDYYHKYQHFTIEFISV